MNATEYGDFLKRLDSSSAEWRRHIESLSIEELNVNYSVGRTLEQEKKICLGNLTLISELTGSQRTKELLSNA